MFDISLLLKHLLIVIQTLSVKTLYHTFAGTGDYYAMLSLLCTTIEPSKLFSSNSTCHYPHLVSSLNMHKPYQCRHQSHPSSAYASFSASWSRESLSSDTSSLLIRPSIRSSQMSDHTANVLSKASLFSCIELAKLGIWGRPGEVRESTRTRDLRIFIGHINMHSTRSSAYQNAPATSNTQSKISCSRSARLRLSFDSSRA